MYAGGEGRLRGAGTMSAEDARRWRAEHGYTGKKTYRDVKARQREMYENHFGHAPPPGVFD